MLRRVPALAGLLLAAAPAVADITPREVWDDWLASMGDAELTTGSVVEDGETLTVTDLSVLHGTDETGRYAVDVETLTLIGNTDGTVGVTVSPEYPITLTDIAEDGTARETRLLVRHPELEMTISDEDGQRTHAFASPEVRVSVEHVTRNGEPLDLTGGIVLTDAAGQYGAGDRGDVGSVLSAATLEAGFAGTDPEGGGRFDLSFALSGLESENLLQILGPEAADLARDMPDGSSMDGTFTTSGSSFTLDTENEGQQAVLNGTAGPGKADVRLSANGLAYESEGQGARLAVSGSSIPLPELVLEIGQISSGFAFPLLASDEPQPYAFNLSMLDVLIDEGLWNMFDPAGILSRAPGEIVVDVSGKVTIEDDLDAAQAAESLSGEFETIDVNTLRLEVADASAAATGKVEFVGAAENAVPVGQLNLVVTGANTLMDQLIQAGILPQQNAMAAMMMIGTFATEGTGEDELISNIRFDEDGGVHINDQRVR